VQVRRAVLDAAQRERLDEPVARLVLEEALQLQVVHLVVEVERGRMADGARVAYFSMDMNNVFNPSDQAGCAKMPFSRAV
jgi:hypothetical protein